MSIFKRIAAMCCPSPAATTPVVEEVEIDTVARTVDYASTAVALPADYFDAIDGVGFPDVYPTRTMRDAPAGQSPMHRIMTGCHPDTPKEERELLWADQRWRDVVMWVFQNIQNKDDARAYAEKWQSHGYWRAIANTVLRALDEDLVGKKQEAMDASYAYLRARWTPKTIASDSISNDDIRHVAGAQEVLIFWDNH